MDAPLSTLPHVTPVQVWPQLAADYRRRVLRYLAQWALNLATTTPEPLPSEVIHEHAYPRSQHPSRAFATAGPHFHPSVDPYVGA